MRPSAPRTAGLDEHLFAAANAEHGEGADRSSQGSRAWVALRGAAAAGALALAGRRREAPAPGGRGRHCSSPGVKRVADRPALPREPEGTPDDRGAPRDVVALQPPCGAHTFTRVAAASSGSASSERGRSRVWTLRRRVPRLARRHYPSDVASGFLFGRAVARLWPRAEPGPPRPNRPWIDSVELALLASVGWPVLDRFRSATRSRSHRTGAASPSAS